MTEINFSIATGADDGLSRTDGSGWSNNGTEITIGKFSTSLVYHGFFRFSSVTIPSDAIIDSVAVRFTSGTSQSGTTVRLNVHFEAADDPAAPVSGADLVGRPLGSAVAWDGLGSWTAGNTYDTPDLTSELQAVIDRGGWNSGQAIICHVIDDGSSDNARRLPAAFENSTYAEAQLIGSYHLPFQPVSSESITIEENISLASDLITQEHIGVAESVTTLLGFDESLPLFTQDITLTESVTMIRGLAGLPAQSEDIELSESLGMLLGFDESLPTITQDITLSEYSLVDISPTFSVFDSITLWESGNIRPEPSASEQLNLSEYVLTRRGYWADFEDSFTVSDRFDVFHYSNWLRQNRAQSRQRFFFTLTGATDGVDDVELPASSIFARKRSGDPTYLQVTIPSFNYTVEISSRPGGEMLIDMGYEINGVIQLRERILEADLEDISTYEGPMNRSVVLTGHRTQSFGGQVVTFNRAEVVYRGYQTRARSYRFAFVEPFLNPGDTVVIGAESFTCNNIVYIIDTDRTVMEIREAL